MGEAIELEWMGPGGIRLEGACQSVSTKSPDGWCTCALRTTRVSARESQNALRWYLKTVHDLESSERPETMGAFWTVKLGDDATTTRVTQPTVRSGPAMKIAGLKANEAPATPLKTGYQATQASDILQLLETHDSKVGVYLNVPCAYIVAGAAYWGRALRLNDRWLQINTNAVIPGLGVRMRADVTLELAGVKRAVSVYGVMSRKKDLPPGGAYKATVALMIREIDEGDSPGLFRVWLEQHLDARRMHDGKS